MDQVSEVNTIETFDFDLQVEEKQVSNRIVTKITLDLQEKEEIEVENVERY